MRIHSAQLWHVGPFDESIEIEALDHGINILSAANEAGKSTLIKAVARCLFDRHTCKDSEIKTLQPVGTDLSPRIAVVFEKGAAIIAIQTTGARGHDVSALGDDELFVGTSRGRGGVARMG